MGPFDDAQAKAQALANPHGLAWKDGFAGWVPILQVPELTAPPQGSPGPGPMPKATPPVFSNQTPAYNNQPYAAMPREQADEIDYQIFGTEMQFVEVEHDPGECALAEAGAMMYKNSAVEMDTMFGDGSKAVAQGGFMDKLVGAG